MPRTITLSAVQMNASPVPTRDRLSRAAQLIEQAAHDGAQLVVLPELFNTGYVYCETNYERTETLNGQTVQWMLSQAARYDVHLAGSLLVVDGDNTYNCALLVAPDGQVWRYDKHYPYLWERVFFRDGRSLSIAETVLGKIGILLGWDAAHADLWERYAGRVDLLLVLSSVPDLRRGELIFPDGARALVPDMGPAMARVSHHLVKFIDEDVQTQARWMRVPVISAGACGAMQTILPAPRYSVGTMLFTRTDMWAYLDESGHAELMSPFINTTRIIAADGSVAQAVQDINDAYTLAEITLNDELSRPTDAQPEMETPSIICLLVDHVIAPLFALNYRRGLRRRWGARMAPLDADTRTWLRIVGVVAALSFVLGWFLGNKPSGKQ